VRINSPQSSDGQLDLHALAGTAPRGIMVAKSAAASDIAIVRAGFPATGLIALVESIAGIEHLAEIAGAPGVTALAFGAYDLCAELGARPIAEVLATWRSRIVFAARSAGCGAIDTPYLDLADEAGLANDAQRSVDFGFDAKLAIHPRQVVPIRTAFRPSTAEVERAQRVVASVGSGGVGITDGMMVDRPVYLAAQRVLERAAAYG
jgi:citrate lyase beta subunit